MPVQGFAQRTVLAVVTVPDLASPDNSDPPFARELTQRALVFVHTAENEAMLATLCAAERIEFVPVREPEVLLRQGEAFNPDLVLLDETYEAVSGLELCADLRAVEAFRHIPIMILTREQPVPAQVAAALLSGADDYCSMRDEFAAELRARLRVQLRNKRYRDALGRLRNQRNELRSQASRDSLTGALGRRALEQAVQTEFDAESQFAVLFVDIDHFKSVNDTYGHQIGDEVLRRVAHSLQQGRRANDVCGRYGGEEFVLVLRRVAAAHALTAAERLRQAVQNLSFFECDGPSGVTVSIGVAAFDPAHPDETSYSLLRRADAALYLAKREGRNRVVLAPSCADRRTHPVQKRASAADLPRESYE
jgi:two-component system, cell cycle response regulator